MNKIGIRVRIEKTEVAKKKMTSIPINLEEL